MQIVRLIDALVVDFTISVGPREDRDAQISECQTLLGPRRAEEHGWLDIRPGEVSDCSSKRRLWTQYQVAYSL